MCEPGVVPPYGCGQPWGNQTKAKTVLGWNPQKTSYEELVRIMTEHDRALVKRERAMLGA